MAELNDAQLGLLHDHYKDTFSLIREREKQRDNLFLVVIALFGVLFLEAQYPANFQAIFTEATAQGVKLDLQAIPFAAIISVTWTMVLLLAMRYCQMSINIERQYNYLHQLEERLTTAFGDAVLFTREGLAYKNNYPLFSSWTWFFYTIMLPLIIVAAVAALLYLEWNALLLPIYHKIYDTIIAGAVAFSFVLYRILPQFQEYRVKRQPLIVRKQQAPRKTK